MKTVKIWSTLRRNVGGRTNDLRRTGVATRDCAKMMFYFVASPLLTMQRFKQEYHTHIYLNAAQARETVPADITGGLHNRSKY